MVPAATAPVAVMLAQELKAQQLDEIAGPLGMEAAGIEAV